MSKAELLSTLESSGMLTAMYKEGLMSPKVIQYWELYLQVNAQMKVNEGKKRQAVITVSDKMNVSEQQVWNALKFFSK